MNFGISLCLWIGVHKRPLIALSLTLTQSSTPPLLYSHSFSLSLSFSFPFGHWGGGLWSLIKWRERDGEWVYVFGRRGRGGRLSGTVKCNPKSTASSSTTILMEMGNILYQGYHILLEMTVSKVGVDTMATKQLFASSASLGCQATGAGKQRERVREYTERREQKKHSLNAFVPCLFLSSPFWNMMQWDGIMLPFLMLLFWKGSIWEG